MRVIHHTDRRIAFGIGYRKKGYGKEDFHEEAKISVYDPVGFIHLQQSALRSINLVSDINFAGGTGNKIGKTTFIPDTGGRHFSPVFMSNGIRMM